jgi:hypothetical protein
LKTLENRVIGSDFLNGTPIAKEIGTRIGKWDGIKLKSFCSTAKEVPE